jgi:predicted AAA+ superfamily ATPase
MLRIEEADVVARLRADNPWWDPGFRPEGPPFDWPRRAFADRLFRLLRNGPRRAVVVLGARRVGKTTLLLQLVGEAVADRAGPPVLYAALDTPTFAGRTPEDLLRLFEQAVPHDPRGPRLVVFDEVQYQREWERHLKDLVDRFPDTRFVVSGSAGAALKRGSAESGAGRFTEVELPPFTFAEFLEFRGQPLVEVEFGPVVPTFNCRNIGELDAAFLEYLEHGGYPEAILDPRVRAEFDRFVGRDIVDKVLLRDLPILYGITDVNELNRLFAVLAYNTAQEASLEALSTGSGIVKPTIKRYLDYLETAFLIYRLRRVDENARHFQRERGFKVHLVNPTMRSALFGRLRLEDERLGALVESGALAQLLHLPLRRHLHYARWRDGRLDREVDLVALDPATQRPAWAVEIKWSDRPARAPEEADSLALLAEKHRLAHAAVTTRSLCGSWRPSLVAGEIRLVPAALWAFALGWASARDEPEIAALLRETGMLGARFVVGERGSCDG